MVVTVVAGPSEEEAGASTAQVAALVLSSSHQLVSPHAALGTSRQCLDDDVLREFDATRRLSELTMDWGILAAGAASFGEKLQVGFPYVIILLVLLGSYALSLFPFVLFGQCFSRDHIDFYFSTETEKKLTSEISVRKTDLDLYRAEMEIECQTHQREETALRA
jgi:hypothetical protein